MRMESEKILKVRKFEREEERGRKREGKV